MKRSTTEARSEVSLPDDALRLVLLWTVDYRMSTEMDTLWRWRCVARQWARVIRATSLLPELRFVHYLGMVETVAQHHYGGRMPCTVKPCAHFSTLFPRPQALLMPFGFYPDHPILAYITRLPNLVALWLDEMWQWPAALSQLPHLRRLVVHCGSALTQLPPQLEELVLLDDTVVSGGCARNTALHSLTYCNRTSAWHLCRCDHHLRRVIKWSLQQGPATRPVLRATLRRWFEQRDSRCLCQFETALYINSESYNRYG
jgi:hypothetical protein